MPNSYLDNKRVFVAGATGLAGTAVIKHLLSFYPNTLISASYRTTNPLIKDKRIKYVKSDLRDPDNCRKAAKGCDCAVMAAANSYGASSSVSKPHLQVSDNLIINARLFEAFHAEKVKRVVFISSATVYQQFDGDIKEDQLDLNQDPHPAYYGVAWIMRYLEKLCRFWHNSFGLEVLIVRASNIFGPYSKFDPDTSTFIPALIRKAVDRTDPFEIWGQPDVARDVIYSEDFAAAVIAMLNADRIKFDTFNIGSGCKITVAEAVKLALKAAGHNPSKIEYKSDKPTTAKLRSIDITKALKSLDWKPEHTTEDGIINTTLWWKQNMKTWTK
ncbi:MAG: NAD(P)-dependent oxidoreductase [Elusimicrobiota bacterium]